MKTETVFKVGQKVFDHQFGWGEVTNVDAIFIKVEFNCINTESRIYDLHGGYSGGKPIISFTEYTLEGFSQEPPIDYNEYIGKLGMFWGDYPYKMIGVLKSFDLEKEYAFYLEEWGMFKNFQPLTDEKIKILEL